MGGMEYLQRMGASLLGEGSYTRNLPNLIIPKITKGEVWEFGKNYEETQVEVNETVLAKTGVSVGAWLSQGAAFLPGEGEESVSGLGLEPQTQSPD